MAVSMMSHMMPPASSLFSMYASISASIMLLHTMLNQLLPLPAQRFLLSLLRRLFPCRPSPASLLIEERDGLSPNELFSAAETYLCSHLPPDLPRLKLSKRPNDPSLSLRFACSHSIPDSHLGIPLLWRFVTEEQSKKHNKPNLDSPLLESEKRYFELTFSKEFRDTVLDSYIPSVLHRAQIIKEQKKIVRLHTLAGAPSYSSSSVWDSVNLEHPSTFDTLAMEAGLKRRITEDLDRFVRRKEFYRRVGRAWKRGYLLYGPPGTGKSSLIAAMANYLKFDIYDLELTNVRRDSDLRKLLLRTANRSILVIEDIDCTVDLPDRKGSSSAAPTPAVEGGNAHPYRPRETQFTLSGLLNFIDGLWSSCGDERIIVFTTNNKGKLDPALLRPGRMDMHIHMSYLTPDGFRLLASTYLGIQGHHPLLPEIENLIKMKNITPAEVAEELMKFDDVDLSLNEVLIFLKSKTNEEEDVTKIISEKDVEVGAAKEQVTAHDCDFEKLL